MSTRSRCRTARGALAAVQHVTMNGCCDFRLLSTMDSMLCSRTMLCSDYEQLAQATCFSRLEPGGVNTHSRANLTSAHIVVF